MNRTTLDDPMLVQLAAEIESAEDRLIVLRARYRRRKDNMRKRERYATDPAFKLLCQERNARYKERTR